MSLLESRMPSLEELFKGTATPGIASRLGATSASLQDFLNGGTSIGLASRLDIEPVTLLELRKQLGPQGAIGFLVGLAMSVETSRRND
jgi:hypothetical protein